MEVMPVATSVGGGSFSFGKRETWKCPRCRNVIHRSGCFVATAVYGSPQAQQVLVLRAYRDRVLNRSSSGRAFVLVYYRFGPSIARLVRLIPPLGRVARRVLDGFVVRVQTRLSAEDDRLHR